MKFQAEKRRGGRQAKASELILPQEEFERFDITQEINIPKDKILLWKTTLEQAFLLEQNEVVEYMTLFPYGPELDLKKPPRRLPGLERCPNKAMWNMWATQQMTQVDSKFVYEKLVRPWDTNWEFKAAAKLLCPETFSDLGQPKRKSGYEIVQAEFNEELVDYRQYANVDLHKPPFLDKVTRAKGLRGGTIFPSILIENAAWIRFAFPEMYSEIESAFPEFKEFVRSFTEWSLEKEPSSLDMSWYKRDLSLAFAAAIILADAVRATSYGVELIKRSSSSAAQPLPERPNI